MSNKCFVKPCPNKKNQGGFMGNVCIPCFNLAYDISKGKLKNNYHFKEGIVQFIADNWREILEEGGVKK